VGDDALEPVGVAEDPVGHVAAVARAQRALSILVDERIRPLRVVEALHQVFKRSAAPVAVDGVDELLSVAVEPWKLIMMTTYPLAANSSGFQR